MIRGWWSGVSLTAVKDSMIFFKTLPNCIVHVTKPVQMVFKNIKYPKTVLHSLFYGLTFWIGGIVKAREEEEDSICLFINQLDEVGL